MTVRLLALPLLLAVAGCTGGAPSEPNTAVSAAARPSASASTPPLPGVLVQHDCSECNAGFGLDGKHYFVSCEPVSPASVAEEAMGSGTLFDRQVTVRRIKAGTNAGQVAVGPLDHFCGPDTVAAGYFAVALPGAPQP